MLVNRFPPKKMVKDISGRNIIPIIFQSELQRNIKNIPIANQIALKVYQKLSVLISAMVYADTYLKCL